MQKVLSRPCIFRYNSILYRKILNIGAGRLMYSVPYGKLFWLLEGFMHYPMDLNDSYIYETASDLEELLFFQTGTRDLEALGIVRSNN